MPQMTPNSDPVSKSTRKRTRTRTGCLNCRRKKRKCDEARPTCGTCYRRNEKCRWGLQLRFLEENAKGIGQEHPSMRKHASTNLVFEILDVTEDVIRDYDLPIQDDGEREVDASISERSRIQSNRSLLNDEANAPSPFGTMNFTANHGHLPDESSPSSLRQTQSAVANLLYLSQSGDSRDRRPNDSLAHPSTNTEYWPNELSDYSDLQLDEDGIFLPGTAYHELHSTLRNHLINEVNSNVPTRPSTPFNPLIGLENIEDEDTVDDQIAPGTTQPSFLNKEEEIFLWRNWFDEIAPWLDKFDNDRHFKHIIPTLAPSNPHLQYSVLALSARQVELKETTLPHDRSLLLYQQAIHLLLPHLPSRTVPVIASCVILCVLEMGSCSPKAWRRHLDGCAYLLSAVGITGLSGGVEGALFWCFARMDVCGGLISQFKTLIPVEQWATGLGIDADVEMFQSKRNDFHNWANYIIYLVAQILDFLSNDNLAALEKLERWIKLWRYIAGWYDGRPAALHSIITLPSSDQCPFPTILYSNPAAVSGNQMYHTASLLMLQNRPAGLRVSSLNNSVEGSSSGSAKVRSVLWHARQVCGISISNDHHGAWTNSVQPIWIAGRCMSNPAEHKAILELLDRIERESGWSTKWRANDLQEFWGDLGE